MTFFSKKNLTKNIFQQKIHIFSAWEMFFLTMIL